MQGMTGDVTTREPAFNVSVSFFDEMERIVMS